MTILRKPEQLHVETTTMADLVETYNALSGKSIKKFETREIAVRRVEMAMLSAKDRDGHTGVPAGTDPVVKTDAEVKVKAKAKGVPVPPAIDEEDATPVFPMESMAGQLQKAADSAAPIVPREKKKPTPGAKTPSLVAVSATFSGTTTLQPSSQRNLVLLSIQGAADSRKLIADLDAEFKGSTRGYIQKLLITGHIVACSAEEVAAAVKAKAPPRSAVVAPAAKTPKPKAK